jgi:hypothetical protein
MALKRISGRVGSSNMYSYWLGCVWAVKTIWEGEVMDKQEIAEIINNFPLPQEGQKWEWAKEISEALHDRIYGKGEESIEEFKRNFDAWQKSKNDKPKEYCKPFKERYGIEIDGKWTPLSELPHEIEELNKLIKPIKTEKIEKLIDDDASEDYSDGEWIRVLRDKLDEVIDHINKKVGER